MPDLNTLLSDGNSSASRRLRVRLQPRDKKGRWIPTGAALFTSITGIGKVKGKAIGGTATKKGEKNNIRMLVGKGYESQGIPENTVLTVNPKNGELESKIKLDREYLEKKGINPDIQHTLPKAIADQPQSLSEMDPQPADDLDIELATNGLDDEEDKDFRAERSKEPLAQLPPAMETLEGDEVSDLVNGEDSSPAIDGDVQDSVVHGIMNSDLSGEAPDLDSVINEAKIVPEEVGAKDLKRGDVISLGAKQGLKVVTKVEEKSDGTFEVFVQDYDREASVGRFKGEVGFQRVRKAEDAPAPKKPVTEKPKKPEAPRKPKPEVVPTAEKPKPPAEPEAADRKTDDGELIPREALSADDIDAFRKNKLAGLVNEDGEAQLEVTKKGKPKQPLDPNAMLNLLAKTYKSSKFNDQGHLVLMRERSDDNGKSIEWEIRAAITGDRKITYMFNFKDLNTGEEQLLLHKDARDSLQSLMGKSNGPEMLADILTGVQTRTYSKTFDTAIHADDVMERALYFAYQGRTKSIADSTKYYGTGYAEKINYANGTLLEKQVPGVFEAYSSKDPEALASRLRAMFGRLPNDSQTHEIARTTARELFAAKFPEEDKRSFGIAVTMASEAVRARLLDSPSSRALPYSSKDKVTPLEEGFTVEYENNIKELSVVKVFAKQRTNASKPAQSDDIFEYGDYVTVIDADGKKTSLPTTSLAILKDQNTPLTEYKGRVSGRRLREERGLTYNPSTLRFPGQQDVPDRVAPIDNSVPGDTFYGKDGANLGVVVESVPITGKDGKKGYGIMYIDKNGDIYTVAVAAGEERGPKIITSNTTEPTEGTKKASSNASESDPDFDLDSIPFETDPSNVERPKTVGLDFNVPQGAKRNAEQQLALNDEVQTEIDENLGEMAQSLGSGWTFDSSSFNAKSYFNAGELSKLVEEARLQYPDLTDGEIRTLIELKHSKQRGFFGKTKKQMLSDIVREAAIFRTDKGGIQDLRFDVAPNSETGAIEISVPKEQVTKYVNAVDGINTFIDKNPKFLDLVNGEGGTQYVRVVADSKQFASLYGSVSNSFAGDVSGVLGVNISFRDADGKLLTSILINDGSLSRGSKPAGDFGDASEHTFIHEFGHTIGNLITYDKNKSRRIGNEYDDAFSEFITTYGKTSRDEHFADSFAKYVMTGEASDAFLAFLQSSDLVDSV